MVSGGEWGVDSRMGITTFWKQLSKVLLGTSLVNNVGGGMELGMVVELSAVLNKFASVLL